MNNLSSLNPWNWNYTPQRGAISVTIAIGGVLLATAGVLAILASLGVSLSHVNKLKVLSTYGGGAVAGTGAATAFVTSAWFMTKQGKSMTAKPQPTVNTKEAEHNLKKLRPFDFPSTTQNYLKFRDSSSRPFSDGGGGLPFLSYTNSLSFQLNKRAFQTNKDTLITLRDEDYYPGNIIPISGVPKGYIMGQIPVVIGYCSTTIGQSNGSSWAMQKDYFYELLLEKKVPIALCITPSQQQGKASASLIKGNDNTNFGLFNSLKDKGPPDAANLFPVGQEVTVHNRRLDGTLPLSASSKDKKLGKLLYREVVISNTQQGSVTPSEDENSVVIAHACEDVFMKSFGDAVEVVRNFSELIQRKKINVGPDNPLFMGCQLGDVKSGGAILIYELLERLESTTVESFVGDDFYTHLQSLAQDIDNQSVPEGATAFLKHMFPKGDPGASFFKHAFKK